jgi:hypothetical protein
MRSRGDDFHLATKGVDDGSLPCQGLPRASAIANRMAASAAILFSAALSELVE